MNKISQKNIRNLKIKALLISWNCFTKINNKINLEYIFEK